MKSQGTDIAEPQEALCAYLHSEGVLYECLQAYAVERIHTQVCLYAVGGAQGQFLLSLYVLLQYAVFLAIGLFDGSLFDGFSCILPFQDVLQAEALEFLQFGAWQVATEYAQGHHLLVLGHGVVVWFQHLLLDDFLCLLVGKVLCPLLLRHDDGTKHVALLRDGCLVHVGGVLLYLCLYLGRLYVLAVGQDDDFLAPSGDVDTSCLVKACQVARVDETVPVYGGCRFFGTVVIALHHIRTLGAQFAHHHTAFLHGSHLAGDYLALYRGQGQAHATGYVVSGTCECYDGSRLRHAIAFQQVQAQCFQSPSYLGVQCGTTADTELYVASHLLVHLLEDEA